MEINVRRTVFYPDKPGMNYITVRGFTLRHAATPWAPPTAEQIGLIGTHWSKGWIIENNVISHSICSGIALGKYGDQWDNTSANTAEGYVKTIERALPERLEQGNHRPPHRPQQHHLALRAGGHRRQPGRRVQHRHRQHHPRHPRPAAVHRRGDGGHQVPRAPSTSEISRNHIYRTCRGLWLDWMAQGTRVSGNLFHDNAGEDLFVEVDHGPFLVDNNLFLSESACWTCPRAAPTCTICLTGKIISRPEPSRPRPIIRRTRRRSPASCNIKGGDDRFYNNIFVGNGGEPRRPRTRRAASCRWESGFGLWVYDGREFPLQTGGNVYCNGARPYQEGADHAIQDARGYPKVKLVDASGHLVLHLNLGPELQRTATTRVTTKSLGKARVAGVAYDNPDGSALTLGMDFLRRKRSATHPTPGPFEHYRSGAQSLELW